MALDLSGLTNALQSMLGGQPSAGTAGDVMATAIGTFAATGQANGIPAVVPPAAVSACSAALGAQFAVVPGTPGGAANGIATAIATLWLATTFVGMVAPPVPGGTAALISALTAIFGVVGGTAASKASDIANAIKTDANLVLVTFPVIGPFPVV